MKPIAFPEANCVFAKDQPQYLPLPVLMEESQYEGAQNITSCWSLSWRERIKLLVSGKVYCTQVASVGLQPQRLHLTLRGE